MSESYDIDILRQATNKVVSSTQNLLDDLLAANDHLDPSQLRDVLLEAFPQIIEGGSELAATAAAEWYEDLHNKHAGGTYRAILARPINPDQLEGTVRAAVHYLYTDNPIAAQRLLHGAIQRYITSQVRDTTIRNALADRAAKRFARVPSGKTCAWCSMLASRGFVYASAKSAGALGQYHDDCNCQIVPAFGSKDPVIKGYDPASLYEDYLQARNELIKEGVTGPALDDKAIAARMRRIGDYTDSITPAHVQGWVTRSSGVRLPTGLSLAPHELATADRLAEAGMTVTMRPIDNTPGVKNPDAEIDGEVWEFKAPKGSGKNTISEQFKRAGHQAERLVLDLRRSGLDDEQAISESKRRFFGRQKLKSLIVIDHDGSIHTYHLDDVE